ncbi:MAG: hypothetical protein EON54_27005 [Alcaligenaceae bacterium]|nr:MAG: hypothetical protein EON54_27005 [Alcaligenaceae bacterium]
MKYPNLHHFFGSYFHQDCFDDLPTAEAILRLYASAEPIDVVKAALGELRELLASITEEVELGALIGQLGCYYRPAADHLTNRKWINEVVLPVLERSPQQGSAA